MDKAGLIRARPGVLVLHVLHRDYRSWLKIQRLDVKDGQYGPYTVFSADGDSYTAYGRHHTTLSRYKVGDDIDFAWEQKGNYKRVTSVNGPGVSTGAGPSGSVGPSRPVGASSSGSSPYRKDPTEFNVMMATRYALDALIGNQATTAAEAVALIKELYNGFIEKEKEAVKESL